MPLSGYRVEWIINRLRRWQGLVAMVARRRKASPDRVELSEEGSAHDFPEGGLEQGVGDELLAVDLSRALAALGEIVGETTADDLLERIFAEFCIGK